MGSGADARRGGHGRVVMLVDNGVRVDSRVQKVARSAADAGWEVFLLGRATAAGPETWQLGRAEVRLLPLPDPLERATFLRRLVIKALGERKPAPAAVTTAATATATEQPEPAPAPKAAPPARRGAKAATKAAVMRAAKRAYRPYDAARTRFWLRLQGDRAWRRLEPSLWDYEIAYGPVIDELAPDLIHAHDFRMLGVGARAKARAAVAGRPVRLVWDAHEFLPGIKPWGDSVRWLPAHRAHEREYAHDADAVVTVSETLAAMLRDEHGLAELPSVVLNAPAADHGPAAGADEELPDLRADCGIDAATPLVVYSGAAAPQRGLAVMVEALPRFPDVHVAFVVNDMGRSYVNSALVTRAAALGAADRVHVLPYVSHWHVVSYLAAADAGVIPILHWPNHEIALITKFFEYSHARLPMVVSDVRAMAATVRETGQGEVFRADDVDDYVRALRAVLDDPARYRAAYDRPGRLDVWTWEAQAQILDKIYHELLPDRPADRVATT
jgi:glycogen synthase